MNVKTVLVLLVLALATIFALVCVLLTRERAPGACPQQPPEQREEDDDGAAERSLVFADLSAEELAQVVRYLRAELGVPLVEASRALPSDNCICWVEVQPPGKAEALRFLDGAGARPAREALAVLHLGAQAEPNVTEYVVGPLPAPTYHRDVTVRKYGAGLPYHRRTVTAREYADIEELLRRELRRAPRFLRACCRSDGSDLAALTTAPRGARSGDRATWFVLFHAVPGTGFFLSPVGLEVLVDHSALDVSRWRPLSFFYNGRHFPSAELLEAEFLSGNVSVVSVEKPAAPGPGSLQPRRLPDRPPPMPVELRGPRYRLHGDCVFFQGWSFCFGMSPSSGPRLSDVRFRRERLLYELSLQEALALYGANCPGAMSTRYLDASFGIGRSSYELVRGVDCPYLATYVDRHYVSEAGAPAARRASLCLFEHDEALPLRRHFSDAHSAYYGGLRRSALVLRAVSTLINYDYVWDFLFHASGALEVRVHATGYISSCFLHGRATDYGNRVGEHTLGTMHLHHMHYKVDLDVAGRPNWLETQDMEYEAVQAPWPGGPLLQRPVLRRRRPQREDEAAFPLGAPLPRYVTFAGAQRNKWGHPRSYRLQLRSAPAEPLPARSPMERALSWGRYQLAVTRRKEEEPSSSSVHNQNDPWTPSVAFADFINNETIAGEDLVAWVTVGFLHVPHAEDVPNTVTVGNGVGFLLRPYNYFDEDPSVDSPDSTYLRPEGTAGGCGGHPLGCPPAAACAPPLVFVTTPRRGTFGKSGSGSKDRRGDERPAVTNKSHRV
ncbi:membrane primary amine oxidase-like [Nothoprocta perdicaria]|uniref:membrane primary amine oxidase-like n=1 Tax=Nothoprocta perdicaria TaxID=30464 RepID=UPI000E1C376E|nr:membrane primary amine oxidase-like [Nothoprocta perdicaria]